uniref:Uncharacterized protein n=1 Tax=Anguilla anguilla TaxID=7936 RepID=A0A0E9V675_ANGAN
MQKSIKRTQQQRFQFSLPLMSCLMFYVV